MLSFCKHKNYSNPFRICIFLFLSYSVGIETIEMFQHSRSSLENPTRFQTKMDKVYTRFQTKTAQKPYPMGGTYLYGLYKGVPTPPGLKVMVFETWKWPIEQWAHDELHCGIPVDQSWLTRPQSSLIISIRRGRLERALQQRDDGKAEGRRHFPLIEQHFNQCIVVYDVDEEGRFSQKYFWRENVTAVVILLRVLARIW